MEYTASYTAGGLLYNEIEQLLPVLTTPNWKEELREDVLHNKFLLVKTESARKRIVQEVVTRFSGIDAAFWDLYTALSESSRKALLFYNCLNSYKLIYDFHFNVTVPRYQSLDNKLDEYWYEMRYQEIASTDPEVGSWSESTKKKVISRYIGMLKDAGLLVRGKLVKPDLQPSLYCYLLSHQHIWGLDAFFLKLPEKEMIIKLCNDD